MITVALASLFAVQWAHPPNLGSGDRVRVHVLHQQTYGGTLTSYSAGQGLALERDKFLFIHPKPEALRFQWSEVYGIDVPGSRDWLSGAVAGAGLAIVGAGVGNLLCSAFGGNQPGGEGCPFWESFGRYALVTVPVGALLSWQFTRWQPAYRRNR